MGQQISNEPEGSIRHHPTINHETYDDMIYSLPLDVSSTNSNNNHPIDISHPSSSSPMHPTTTSTTTNSFLNELTNIVDNKPHLSNNNEKSQKRKSTNFTEAISMMHQQTLSTNSNNTSTLTIVSSHGSMYHHKRSDSNTSQESPTTNPNSTLSSLSAHKHLSIDSKLFALLNNKSNNSSDSNNRSSRSFQPIRPFSISSLDSLGFDGINKVLKDKLLLSQFRNYTKMEYSEENLDIFLVSNQLLEECKKNLDNVIDSSSSNNSENSKRNSTRLFSTNQSKSKLMKIAQSQFVFEEKIIKKLEKSLEQVIEKMQKMNLEKRKSLMKGRRKNTEFLGIDRNIFKQSSSGNSGNETSMDGNLFEESLFASSSFSSPSFGAFNGLEEINVGKKLKIQIEKIKENNQIQQQWLASKRSSKRLSMKFFSSSAILNATTITTTNSSSVSQSNPSNLEGSSLSPMSLEDQDFEEIPQIKIVQFLEDLRFECLMNLKDTFIRFCQQNKLSFR